MRASSVVRLNMKAVAITLIFSLVLIAVGNHLLNSRFWGYSGYLKSPDSLPKNPNKWIALANEKQTIEHPLPAIEDIHYANKYEIDVDAEFDIGDSIATLRRHQSEARFIDIHSEHIPGYSEIRCRPDLGLRIPNVVHYLWLGSLPMKFHHYLSLRSAASIQQPSKLLVHADNTNDPTGRYWERLKGEVPCLEIVRHEHPATPHGGEFPDISHQSDILRLQILLNTGGIFIDANSYILMPMDALLNESFVIGQNEIGCYGNSVMLSEPRAPFLRIWMEHYKSIRPWQWREYNSQLPARLHRRFPKTELHVLKYSMTRPNYRDGFEWMRTKNWDFSQSYAVTLHENKFTLELAPFFAMPERDAVRVDSTFGQIVRKSLFGEFHFTEGQDSNELRCSKKLVNRAGFPNILHLLWQDSELSFLNYVSIRSGVKAFIPYSVVFHIFGSENDVDEPSNYLWVKLQSEIPCLVTNRLPTDLISIARSESRKQLLKLKLLIAYYYGGVVWNMEDVILHSISDELDPYSGFALFDEDSADRSVVGGRKTSEFLAKFLKIMDTDHPVTFYDVMKVAESTGPQSLAKGYPFTVITDNNLTVTSKGRYKENLDGYHFEIKSTEEMQKYDKTFFTSILNTLSERILDRSPFAMPL